MSVHALMQITRHPLTLSFSRCTDTEVVSQFLLPSPPILLGCSFSCPTAPLQSKAVTTVPLHWSTIQISPLSNPCWSSRGFNALMMLPWTTLSTSVKTVLFWPGGWTRQQPEVPSTLDIPMLLSKTMFSSGPRHCFHFYCTLIWGSSFFPPRSFTRPLKTIHKILALISFYCVQMGGKVKIPKTLLT